MDGATSLTFNGQGNNTIIVNKSASSSSANFPIQLNLGGGTNTLTLNANGQPMQTLPNVVIFTDPLTVTYSNVQTLQINNASTVNAIAGPDTTDRASALNGLTGNARFVQALYLDDLGRVGDLSNVQDAGYWLNGLNTRRHDATSVASGILQSFEGRDYLVKSWYQSFLGRSAGGGEEVYFVNLAATRSDGRAGTEPTVQ